MIPETFVILLLAHLLADFPLQPERIARNKRKLSILILHIAIVGATALLALGYWDPVIIGTIVATHFAIDLAKARIGKNDLAWFIGDQSAHILVLAGIAAFAPADLSQSAIYAPMTPELVATVFKAMALACGLLIAVVAGTYAVGLFVKPFVEQIDDSLEGLKDGGKVIGQLERLLVFVFTVSHNPAGIGFLIAAKSILRFGDISDHNQRKTAEYIIIGTLFSFAWAISFSQLALWAAARF